jgi:ribosomal protein S27AE
MQSEKLTWHKGQCPKCKITYRWTGGPVLIKAKCPKCGGGLSWASWNNSPWEPLRAD